MAVVSLFGFSKEQISTSEKKKAGLHFTLTGVFVGSLRGHENLNGHNE